MFVQKTKTVTWVAVAAGCLGVRLVETEVESSSLILWHYLPLLVLSALGLFLGKKNIQMVIA